MCGRYVVVSGIETIENRFNVDAGEINFAPNYNVSPGNSAPVILNRNRHHLDIGQFGFTPSWAKKQMYLFNARAEGDANKNNDPDYTGGKGIIHKPAFRNAIRHKRCLIIADAFIEGTIKERLNKPYLVYLRNKQRPFAFAGIYDDWANPATGEIILTFAIITTVANDLIRKLPHHRSPVILQRKDEQKWLNSKTPLTDITALLRPYPADEMNAYPISRAIKNPKANGKELLIPVGQPVLPDENIRFKNEIRLFGMGHSPARERKK